MMTSGVGPGHGGHTSQTFIQECLDNQRDDYEQAIRDMKDDFD
jgi:hypothetical protein